MGLKTPHILIKPNYNQFMTSSDPIETLEGGKQANAIRTLVVSFITVGAVVFLVLRDMNSIRAFITDNGALGVVAAVLVYGVLGATLGNILAALVEYYLGHKLSNASSFNEKRQKLPFGLGKLPVRSPVFLIFGRMVPGYGPKLISVMAGMYHVPMLRYLWTTLIPTLLGAAIFAYGGFGILHLFGYH